MMASEPTAAHFSIRYNSLKPSSASASPGNRESTWEEDLPKSKTLSHSVIVNLETHQWPSHLVTSLPFAVINQESCHNPFILPVHSVVGLRERFKDNFRPQISPPLAPRSSRTPLLLPLPMLFLRLRLRRRRSSFSHSHLHH